MQADILQQHFESAFLWADLSLFHSQTRHWELQSLKKISLPDGIYSKQWGTGVVSHPEAERPGNAVFPAHQLNHHTTAHTMVSLVQTSSFILPSLIWKVIDVSCFEFRWLFFEDCYKAYCLHCSHWFYELSRTPFQWLQQDLQCHLPLRRSKRSLTSSVLFPNEPCLEMPWVAADLCCF